MVAKNVENQNVKNVKPQTGMQPMFAIVRGYNQANQVILTTRLVTTRPTPTFENHCQDSCIYLTYTTYDELFRQKSQYTSMTVISIIC